MEYNRDPPFGCYTSLRNTCVALESKSRKGQKEGSITSYCKTVSYLLKTYATNNVTAETDANMMQLNQTWNKSPTEYAKALWNQTLRRNREYDGYVLKCIFIDGFWKRSATV